MIRWNTCTRNKNKCFHGKKLHSISSKVVADTKDVKLVKFFEKLTKDLNLHNPIDWNSLTSQQIISNGGKSFLKRYSLFELKCLGCPEGRFHFFQSKKPAGFWENKNNIQYFLNDLTEKLNLNTFDDWEKITSKQIILFGGSGLLKKYSLYEIKCLGYSKGKDIFSRPSKPPGYWENQENIQKFLDELKEKLDLKTPNDWDLITQKVIKDNGGRGILDKYSMNEVKLMACPDLNSLQKFDVKYWQNKDNINKFLDDLREKLNLQTPKDWNLITWKQIFDNGGNNLRKLYSLYDIKCIGCPEGKEIFQRKIKDKGYWEKQENIQKFLVELKEKLNLKTPNDWDSITQKDIKDYGGSGLIDKYTINTIKRMACPEGKNIFTKANKPSGFWDNKENIQNFIIKLKENFNLQTPEDWNSITQKQIISLGGSKLLHTLSVFDIKYLGCPEGKLLFSKPNKPSGYWKKQENVLHFLDEIKEKLNLRNYEDWNLITVKDINRFGGGKLLHLYTLFELKCLGCPEGISSFSQPRKPSGYWKNENNIKKFLNDFKKQLKLNSPNDWELISTRDIKFFGGCNLLERYTLYDLKCIGCPEGKKFFSKPNKPPGYWENEDNIQQFIDSLKETYQLKNLEDWKRLSIFQIRSQGGQGLLSKYSKDDIVQTQLPETDSASMSVYTARSSQRWLFLQIQKLFPHEEIVEDYFHSEISRKSGFAVQFDVFLVEKKIAFEYHGKQHYEDIPSAFAPIEMYRLRDFEKQKLCRESGIQLIVIPYWWDNSFESLQEIISPPM